MVRLKLSEGEKKYLIKELAERVKDLVFMNALDKTKEAVDILLQDVDDKDVSSNQEFLIEFAYRLTIGDILQIVGEYRRRIGQRG